MTDNSPQINQNLKNEFDAWKKDSEEKGIILEEAVERNNYLYSTFLFNLKFSKIRRDTRFILLKIISLIALITTFLFSLIAFFVFIPPNKETNYLPLYINIIIILFYIIIFFITDYRFLSLFISNSLAEKIFKKFTSRQNKLQEKIDNSMALTAADPPLLGTFPSYRWIIVWFALGFGFLIISFFFDQKVKTTPMLPDIITQFLRIPISLVGILLVFLRCLESFRLKMLIKITPQEVNTAADSVLKSLEELKKLVAKAKSQGIEVEANS